MSDKIIYEKGFGGRYENDAATIILNNPSQNNLVNDEMLTELIEIVKSVSQDKKLKLLVLKSNGDNFCAGRDSGGDNRSIGGFKSSISNIISLNRALASLDCVTMALVQGKAFGMGAGIALQSDLTVASEDAQISFPEINKGLPPAVVLSYIKKWLPKKKALEMVFTGKTITASQAEQMFFVNEVTNGENLAQRGMEWADILCSKNTDAVHMCKSYLRQTDSLSLNESIDFALLNMTEWKAASLDK